MREIINFHVGQAGVQLGSAMWELFCVEHLVDEEGNLVNGGRIPNENIETYFSESPSKKMVPRGIFVDLEPSVIDELKAGGYRHLYHPDRLIRGFEDAASNFARGFFTVGKVVLNQVATETRKMFESCDHLYGMMIYRSLGGGTGSGLTSALFDILADYVKIPKLEIPIYPSPTLSSSTVEPYNSVLAQHFCIEDTDISLLFDNEALYDISSRFFSQNFLSFSSINRIIVQIISSITASIRFENTLNSDMSLMQINLVPYPRIHFPLCNFSPMCSIDRQSHDAMTVDSLTRGVFEPDNQMVKVDMKNGRFMSCALFYRGEISPYDVYQSLSHIKRSRRLEFVEWCPTGFKVGINLSFPMRVPDSFLPPTSKNVAMLTNTSAIGQVFQRICHKFYLLYSKRSFLHWFVGEGMEEVEFTESLYNMTALVKDYEEVSQDASEKLDLADNFEQTEPVVGVESPSMDPGKVGKIAETYRQPPEKFVSQGSEKEAKQISMTEEIHKSENIENPRKSIEKEKEHVSIAEVFNELQPPHSE